MAEQKNKIFLTGFMGSGKSTLAPLIANVFGYDSVDIDSEIERQTGLAISEIFRIHGERYFREVEQSLLLQCSRNQNIVVALGGGTVTFGTNINIIQSSGLLVYLKIDPELIIRRVKRKQTRPLLHDEDGTLLNEDALRDRISTLLEVREQFYSQADITVIITDISVARTVDNIVRHIRRYVEE